MPGKVFVSCGQRDSERECAEEIGRILKDAEFGLTPYLAFRTQSLDDIMTITHELKSSDYYLFVDFVRKSPADLPCSLFTHQELALAHHLGFRDMIALQENGAPLEGFLRYILSNPVKFSSREELYSRLKDLVRERKWCSSYSRNLVVEPADTTWKGTYMDQTGIPHMMKVWSIKIRNMRPDVAAVRTLCILDYIENIKDGQTIRENSPDRSYLKWSGQMIPMGYELTILPNDFGVVNLLAVHEDAPGLFLLSARDAPREPIRRKAGEYQLHVKVFSEGFPLLSFVVPVTFDPGKFGFGMGSISGFQGWEMQVERFGPPTVL
jgi:hypothetical protein